MDSVKPYTCLFILTDYFCLSRNCPIECWFIFWSPFISRVLFCHITETLGSDKLFLFSQNICCNKRNSVHQKYLASLHILVQVGGVERDSGWGTDGVVRRSSERVVSSGTCQCQHDGLWGYRSTQPRLRPGAGTCEGLLSVIVQNVTLLTFLKLYLRKVWTVNPTRNYVLSSLINVALIHNSEKTKVIFSSVAKNIIIISLSWLTKFYCTFRVAWSQTAVWTLTS